MNKAMETGEEARVIAHATCGDYSQEVAASLSAIADIHYAEGRLDEAFAIAEEELVVRRILHGDKHPNIAICISRIAGIYSKRGFYAESVALFKKALKIQRRTLGHDHEVRTAPVLNLICFVSVYRI
jgi:tetratricopeptide (TPR) repeat protein